MNRRQFLKGILGGLVSLTLGKWVKPQWLRGQIEDVQCYDYALSPKEIRGIHRDWCDGKPLSETEFRILQSSPWDMFFEPQYSNKIIWNHPLAEGLVRAWFVRDGVIVEV